MRADLDKAAQGLEAFFVRQLMKEALPDLGGDAQFGAMLQDALAEELAKGGGLGVSQAMVAQLDPDAALQAPVTTAPLALRSATAPTRALSVYRAHGHDHGAPTISSRFGARHDPITGRRAEHHGVDVAAPEGRGVRAAFDGTITRVDHDAGGYGRLVVVDHGNGVESRYAHLSATDMKVGQRVSRGETVGAVGSTGRSTGPHLHFELRRGGTAIDPTKVVDPRTLVAPEEPR